MTRSHDRTRSHPTRRARLPGPARRAVRALEQAFTCGTEVEYAAALDRLVTAAAALTSPQRELLNAELAAAHDRVTVARELATWRSALAGPWEPVEQLPGHVELVRLPAGGPQMLATVPAVTADDAPAVRDRVGEARAAVRSGRCPRCHAALAWQMAAQAALQHASGCPLSEDQIAALRARYAEVAQRR